MGTFERIRKISPYFFAFFAVILVAFFTIGDPTVVTNLFGGGGGGPAQTKTIATINGEAISFIDFSNKVNNQIEQQRSQAKEGDPEINDVQVRKSVWSSIIDETIINQEAKKAGIVITNAEIADELLYNPPAFLQQMFMDSTKTFDKSFYLSIVTNPEKLGERYPEGTPYEQIEKAVADWRGRLILIENYMKGEKLKNNLMALVNASGSLVSPTYATEKYTAENSTANVNYIAFNANEIPDAEVNVSDEDLKAYYDSHKANFEQRPQRQIQYVTFRMTPSTKDSLKANQRIQRIMDAMAKNPSKESRDSIYEVKLSEYGGETFDFKLIKDIDRTKANFIMALEKRQVAGPYTLHDGTYFFRLDDKREGANEVVKASHILVKFNDNKDSAKAAAKKIFAQAKKGEDFAKLARELSTGPSASNGGDLGYFGAGQMPKELDAACFAANIGDILGPIETQFGYHVIKVYDKKSEELKFSEIKIAPKVSTVTRNNTHRQAYSFKKQLEEGMDIDTLAARLNRTAMKPDFFEKNRPILGSQYMTDIAFKSEVGSVMEPLDTKYYGIVVAKVSGERKAGVASFDSKKDYLTQKVKNIKKLDMLKAKAEAVYSKVKSSDLMAAFEADPSLNVKTTRDMKNIATVPGVGKEPAFAAYVFSKETGKVLQPLRGETGYYIIQVNGRNTPDDATIANALPTYILKLKAAASGYSFYQWLNEKKIQAQIEDFRNDFYKEY